MRISIYSFYLILLTFLPSIAQEKGQEIVVDSKGHTSIIRKVLFSGNNKKIYSVSEDKTMRVWDTKSQQLINTFWGNVNEAGKGGEYNALSLSPDNKLIAVGGNLDQHEIAILNLSTGEQIASLLGHEGKITDLQFSADGEYLISSGVDQTVRVWYMPFLDNEIFEEEPYEELTIEEHTDLVYNIDLSDDGSRLVTSSFDGTVKMYSMSVGMKSASLMKVWETADKFTNVEISVDNKFVVAGDDHGRVYVWNTNGTEVASLTDTKGFITSLDFSDNDELLLVTDSQGRIVLYDTEAWEQQKSFKSKNGIVSSAQFANSSKDYILVASGHKGEMQLWDLNQDKIVRVYTNQSKYFDSITSMGDHLYTGHNNDQYAFDFTKMKLMLHTSSSQKGTQLSKDGWSKVDDYTLKNGTLELSVDPKKDGKIVTYGKINNQIIVSNKKSLKVFSEGGEEKFQFMGHNKQVNAMSALHSDKYLLTFSLDQTYKVWNLATGELLVSLFISKNDDWVVWSPQGYYSASAGGEKYVGWLMKKEFGDLPEFSEISTFAKMYHQPQVLQKIYTLGGFQSAQTTLDLKEKEHVLLADVKPKIEWISPQAEEFVVDGKVMVEAIIKSSTSVKTIKLLIDGRPIVIRDIETTKEGDHFNYHVKHEYAVGNEEKTLRMFIENQNCNWTSPPKVIVSETEDETLDLDIHSLLKEVDVIEKKNLYVLSVGVSEHQHEVLNINGAHKNALAISDLFLGQQRGHVYNDVKVTRLTNSDADKASILFSLSFMNQQVSANDIVIVYLSTHGTFYKDQFHLTTYDTNPNSFSSTSLNWKELTSELSKFPAQVILILDTQHNEKLGAIFKNTQNVEGYRNISSNENGVVVLAAATGKESSLNEEASDYSIFTSSILNGISKGKADYTGNQLISLKELVYYLSKEVKEKSGGKQHPDLLVPTTLPKIYVGEIKSN
ncbi:caspase family protein [Flammeovirga pacifica]|uniref:Peptidase C14 caspase domain-containing protein n=1 Tax=Flammeovirga pacifica TaxID=915059 RepID=A0A1S1YXP7_FLAPC|nr:caspase family protein [Flammeovirga pacifica]OHX65778.1 hypothetical protein NH26_05150 [Flammeovirga pacifica]